VIEDMAVRARSPPTAWRRIVDHSCSWSVVSSTSPTRVSSTGLTLKRRLPLSCQPGIVRVRSIPAPREVIGWLIVSPLEGLGALFFLGARPPRPSELPFRP